MIYIPSALPVLCGGQEQGISRSCPSMLLKMIFFGITAESLPRYIKKLPKHAFENGIFTPWPKTYMPEDPDAPWYERLQLAKHPFCDG